MSDSEDYGDGYDDTEFFNAATQAEKENSPAFQPSPRPTKRRKITQTRERTKPVPSRKTPNRRPQPFAGSSDEDDSSLAADDGENSLSAGGKDGSPATSEELPEKRPSNRKKRATSKQHDAVDEDNDASPARATLAQKRAERILIPTAELDMTDVFFTQPPQEHSPP